MWSGLKIFRPPSSLTKNFRGNARSTLATITDIAPVIRQLFAGGGSPQLGADHFSFNLPAGMCPECQGIGKN